MPFLLASIYSLQQLVDIGFHDWRYYTLGIDHRLFYRCENRCGTLHLEVRQRRLCNITHH